MWILIVRLFSCSATITTGVARQGRLDETALKNLSEMLLRPHKHKNRHGNRKKFRREEKSDRKSENCEERDEFSEWKRTSSKGRAFKKINVLIMIW